MAIMLDLRAAAIAANRFGFGAKQGEYVAAARALGLPVAETYGYVRTLPGWQAMEPDHIHPNDALYEKIVTNVLAPAVAAQVTPLRCLPTESVATAR